MEKKIVEKIKRELENKRNMPGKGAAVGYQRAKDLERTEVD